jgi:transcriptional regulator with XRE-family HTH domain
MLLCTEASRAGYLRFMTDEPKEIDWSASLTLGVATEVKRHRGRLGISAQQLAERCKELGMPIQRSVLSNLESGRRTTITVAEVLILAAALEVPPITLFAPAGYVDSVRVLPFVEVATYDAIRYFSGTATLPDTDIEKFQEHPLRMVRFHAETANALKARLERLLAAKQDHAKNILAEREAQARSSYLRIKSSDLDAQHAELLAGTADRSDHDAFVRELISVQVERDEVARETAALAGVQLSRVYSEENVKEATADVFEAVRSLRGIRKEMEERGIKIPPISELLENALSGAWDSPAAAPELPQGNAEKIKAAKTEGG